MNKLLKKLSLVAFALLFANNVNAADNLNLSNKILFVENWIIFVDIFNLFR